MKNREINGEKENFKVIFRRLLIIHEEIKGKKYPNKRTLKKELEVSDSTIARDIEYMKGFLKAPIEYDNSKRGYYYTSDAYFLPAFLLSAEELFSIAVMQKIIVQYKNSSIYPKIEALFNKISGYLADQRAVQPLWLDNKFTFFSEPVTAIDDKVFSIIYQGLGDNRTIKFLYKPLTHDTYMERKMDPYHLICYKGNWYLMGYCHYKNEIRNFSLSRLNSVELTKDKFKIPVDFNVNNFVDSLGVHTSKDKYNIKIKFFSETASYIEERVWQDNQKITKFEDGSIILEYESNQLIEIARWVLSQGKNAVAHEPKELVDYIKSELEETFKNYR